MTCPKLRVHEWIFIGFFAYVAAIAPFFHRRPALHGQPYFLLLLLSVILWVLARIEKRPKYAEAMRLTRDWLPIAFILLAFREMNYFAPRQYDFLTEMSWIRWDVILLDGYGLKQRIESLGIIIPFYLELCYLLVYGVEAYCVGRLAVTVGRKGINRFWNIFLLGTLGAYACFPFFPTEPPRFAFSDVSVPTVTTWLRKLNLGILNGTTIHTGVFPSAHVSAAFSAAFAMLLLMPRGQRDGWFLLLYALSVSIATIYGRYHYAVDVLAGFAISLLAAALCLLYYAHDVKQNYGKP